MSAKMPIVIKHISYYLPEKVYSNHDVDRDFPGSAQEDNLKKIGVEERRIAADGELASDLAVKAAEKLFKEHGYSRSKVDFVLFCAQEFDHYTPTTACLIQSRLGLRQDVGALDYNLGCSGFVYGMGMAQGIMQSMGAKNVLLLTASAVAKKCHPKDRNSRYLFGDGAAATWLELKSEGMTYPFVYGTDGGKGHHIMIKDGGARNPISASSGQENTDQFGNISANENVFMNGTAVFVFGLKQVPKLVQNLLEKADLEMPDIDLFVFHQANEFMIQTIRKKLNIPEDKFVVQMSHVGNTVSSTIPIALYEAQKSGQLKKGMRVMLVAFGTGFSWAGSIVEW